MCIYTVFTDNKYCMFLAKYVPVSIFVFLSGDLFWTLCYDISAKHDYCFVLFLIFEGGLQIVFYFMQAEILYKIKTHMVINHVWCS